MKTITFKNGTQIAAEQNGDCFIVDTRPDFPEDLSAVTVSDGAAEYTLHNVNITECASVDGRYWFAFYELSPAELYRRALDAERDMVLDLLADQEYRLCLIDLGLN